MKFGLGTTENTDGSDVGNDLILMKNKIIIIMAKNAFLVFASIDKHKSARYG